MKGEKSKWNNFIVARNWQIAHDALNKNKNIAILSASDFEDKHPGLGENVYGITIKSDSTRTVGKKEVHEAIGIDLKAANDKDPVNPKASVLSALHELAHWIAYPPEQGKMTVSRDLLGGAWVEGLTEMVVEDILKAQNIQMHNDRGGAAEIVHSQNQMQSYPDQVGIARKLTDAVGINAVGDSFFYGHNTVLANAMMTAWNWNKDTFMTEFPKLRTLVSAGKFDEAGKTIDRLNPPKK